MVNGWSCFSCSWYATGVGEILAKDMQKDASGSCAYETLKASFGIKSPQTSAEEGLELAEVLQVAC